MNIKIGTMNGDVIESGAVKNVTNHYHYYGKEQEETALPEVLTTPSGTRLAGQARRSRYGGRTVATHRAEGRAARTAGG